MQWFVSAKTSICKSNEDGKTSVKSTWTLRVPFWIVGLENAPIPPIWELVRSYPCLKNHILVQKLA